MTMKTSRNRKILDLVMKIVSGLASLIGIIFLAWILFEVIRKGAGALNVSFFTQLTSPPE